MRPLTLRSRDAWSACVLGLVAFVPPFFSAPGALAADTKTYLYLNPGRLLQRAIHLWDPSVAAGTVPHQNIGYLFPMGPYYWLMAHAGVPIWIAQRLWWGTTFLCACLGVLALFRLLDPDRTDIGTGGRFVAALTYQLSPYVVPYVARHSVLLGAWAALPWFIVLTSHAIRRGGWRWPAGFALVLLLVGSINASSLLFVALGPLAWVPYEIFVVRSVPWRRALAAVGRIGLLSLGVSLWWIGGLIVQGRYGVDVLRYTETPHTVAGTSTAVETIRQLGYWYFYGRELFFPFTPQSRAYVSHLWVIAASFAVPILAVASAVSTRWRHRVFLVWLIVIGVVVSVGGHRWSIPSLYQWLWDRFSTTSSGLALRSTPRAVPLVALGLAGLIGAGVTAFGRAVPRAHRPLLGVTVAIVAVNLPPLFTGDLVARAQRQPEQVPSYWKQVAARLSAKDDGSRALVLPGTDFAAYRWGFTLEPILPGLTDRPTLQRETVPYGGLGTVDLLAALDRRLQEGVLDPNAIAPIARRLGVGDIVAQSDLAYERYRTTRPGPLDKILAAAPGLAAPELFGPPSQNEPSTGPLLDERTLGDPTSTAAAAPVSVRAVEDAVPIVRAEAGPAVIVDGNGEGAVDAAAVGLLDRNGPLLYAGDLSTSDLSAARDADLVITDSNRDRPRGWGNLRDVYGATRVEGQKPLKVDLSDVALNLFGSRGPDVQSHAVVTGVASVQATHEGQPLWYTPEDRAVNALDGDPLTDWRVIRFSKPKGERLIVTLDGPVTTDHVTLLQTITNPRSPITKVKLHFDTGPSVDVALGAASLAEPGQTVTFPTRTFRRLELELIDSATTSDLGFAEVKIPGVRAEELISVPTDLTAATAATALDHRLFIVMNRERSDPADAWRRDEERRLGRQFSVAAGRAFSVAPQIHLAPRAPDDVVDRALGYPDAAHGGLTLTSSGHLPGSFGARARSAFDGDPTTAWQPIFESPQTWVQADLPAPVTFDHLDLQLVTDARHSVPTQIVVDTADGQQRVVDLPPLSDDGAHPNATTPVTVRFPPLTATAVRITVSAVRPVTTVPNGGHDPIALPVGIAEVGLPGVQSPPAPAELPSRCLDDLLTVDGRALSFRVSGRVSDALAGRDLTVSPCDSTALTLATGSHALRTAPGDTEGLDVDRVLLASDRGGDPLALTSTGTVPAPAGPPVPRVRVIHNHATSIDLAVTGASGPFWLVLGQSENAGWHATIRGATGQTQPRLVDGYANGWRLTPSGSGVITVHLEWTPQREVWVVLVISLVSAVVCLALVTLKRTRRPYPASSAASVTNTLVAPWAGIDALPPAVAVAVAAGGAVLLPPVAAVIAAAIVLVARARLRFMVGLAPPLLLALVGGGVVAGQLLRAPEAGYGWPGLFDPLDPLVWVAIALLVVAVHVPGSTSSGFVTSARSRPMEERHD